MEALEGPNIDYRGVTTKDGVRGLTATDASFKKGVELCASSKLEEVQLLGDDLSQGTAICAGSSAGDSYVVTFKVEETESGWHTTASCTCPAAANVKPGQICKHSVALLLRRVNEIDKRRSSGAIRRFRTDGNSEKGKLQSLNTWAEASLSKRKVTVADSAEPPPISKLAEDGLGVAADDPAMVSIPKPGQSENASSGTTIAPGRRMLPSWMTKEAAPLPKTRRKGGKAAAEGDDDLQQDGSESKRGRARGATKRALTARPPAPRKRKVVGGFKIDSDSGEDDPDTAEMTRPSSASRQAGRQQAGDEEAAVGGSRRVEEENMENSSVLSITDEKVGGRVQKAAAAAVGRRGVFDQNQQRRFEGQEGGKDVQRKRNRRKVHRVDEEDDDEQQAVEEKEKEKEKENESNASGENERERTRRDGLRQSKGLGKAGGRRNEVKKSRKARGRNDDDDEDWLDDNRQGENVRDASDDGFGFSSEDLLRYAQERLGEQQGAMQEEVLPLAGQQTCRQGTAEEKSMPASDKGKVERSKETANVSDARPKPVSLWERLQSTQAPSLRFNLNQVLEDADQMRKSKEETKNKEVTALDKAATVGLHPCGLLGRTSGRCGGPSLRATGGPADGPADGEPDGPEWGQSENSGVSVDAGNPFPSEMRVGEEEKYRRVSDGVAADPDDIKHKVVNWDETEDGGSLGHVWGPDKRENSDNENDDDLLKIFLPGYRRSRKTKGVDDNAARVGVDADDGGRSMQVHTQTRSSPQRTPLDTKALNIEQQDLPFSSSISTAHTSNFSERTKESLFEDVAGNKGVGYTGQAMGVMRPGQPSSSSGLTRLSNEVVGRYDGGSYSFNRDGLGHSSDEFRMGSGSDTSCVQNLVGVQSIATSDTGPWKAKEAPNDSSQPQKKSSLKERLMKLGIGSWV